MKKILIAAAVTATLMSSQAFAQAKNFEGFSVGLNIDWMKVKPTNSNIAVDEESSANLGLQGQYNFALSDQFVLGLGATYELTKPKAGTAPSTNVSSKATSVSSFYVAPGFAVNDTILIYGKVASLAATVDYSDTSTTNSFSGLGYGIGVQNLLTKNLLIQAEVLSSKYDDKTVGGVTLGGTVTTLSVGVGYKF
jgi:outer membrane immunogenic protein